MLKQILIVLSVLATLTLVANAGHEKAAFAAKLANDSGDVAGYAKYAEVKVNEEEAVQYFAVEVKAEPDQVIVISIDGTVFAKMKTNDDGKASLEMKGHRKLTSDKSELPVVKTGSVIKLTSGSYGYFEEQ